MWLNFQLVILMHVFMGSWTPGYMYESEWSVVGYTTYMHMLMARENQARSTKYVWMSGLITEGNSKQEFSTADNTLISRWVVVNWTIARMRPCRIYSASPHLMTSYRALWYNLRRCQTFTYLGILQTCGPACNVPSINFQISLSIYFTNSQLLLYGVASAIILIDFLH